MNYRTCREALMLGALSGLLLSGLTIAQDKAQGNGIARPAALPGDGDLPTLWRSVDAVVYLRVQEAVGNRTRILDRSESSWAEYRAVVHEVFRRFRGQPGTSLTFWQPVASQAPPLSSSLPGPEYVAFLRWNDVEELFEPVVLAQVADGSVQSSRIQGLEAGMKLEAFLKLLRAMMESG